MVVQHFVFILLNCLLIVLTSNALGASPFSHIHDFSDLCYNGQIYAEYLTRGMGRSDTKTVIVANTAKLDCTFRFLVGESNFIIVVIEFPDWLGKSSPCGNNKVSVMVRTVGEINVCDELKKKESDIFHFVERNEINVTVLAHNELDTLKVTATSLIDAKWNGCDVDSEILCTFNGVTYCMTNFVLCDNIANCGVREKFDEEKWVCSGYDSITPFMIFLGIVTVLVTFVLLVAFLKNVLPSRRGHFVFQKSEVLSEKDRVTSEITVQVKLRYFTDPNEKPDTISFEQELDPHVSKSIFSRKKAIKRQGER